MPSLKVIGHSEAASLLLLQLFDKAKDLLGLNIFFSFLQSCVIATDLEINIGNEVLQLISNGRIQLNSAYS